MKCAYTCTECGAEFDYRAAYCKDWRNKHQKFACPKCHTFFREGITTVPADNQWLVGACLAAASIVAFFIEAGGFSWSLLGFSISSTIATYCIFGPIHKQIPRLVLIRIDGADDCDEMRTH